MREGKISYCHDEDENILAFNPKKRVKIGEDINIYKEDNSHISRKRSNLIMTRSKNVNKTLPISRNNVGLSNYILCMLSSFTNYLFGKPKDIIPNKFISSADYRIPDMQTKISLFSKILQSNEKFLIQSPWIDNYIIAMSFVYLHRACLVIREYNTENWLYALHLAWEMEEDFPKGKYVS